MKKLLAMLLMLALCVAVMPACAALAENNEATPEVRYSTDGGATWAEDSLMNALWNSYTSSDVQIELLRDIELDSSWYAQQDLGYNGNTVTLDGQGYTIKRVQGAQMLFCVRYESDVTLKDITIDGGAVWSSDDPATRTNTGLSLQGKNAHLIYVDGGATLTLEDGVILQNSDLGSSSYGAAVVVGYSDTGNGTLIMKDGVIIRNNRAESGGAVLVMHSGDSFEMQGGSIIGNYATSGGGAVCVNGGSFVMKGGVISSNASGNNGGGVTVNGSFTLEDGSITDNTSATGGGGVTALSGSVTLEGGSITRNSITGTMGGGILVHNGTLSVSGSPVVSGNTINAATVSNVYLNTGKTIAVSDALDSGASIGVTAKSAPTEGSPVNITGKNSADYSGAFFSDQASYLVVNAENTVQLAMAPTFAVTVENGSGSGSYAAGEIVSITASEPETGKKFAGWVTGDGITLADSSAKTTTFEMPAKAVTVTATYANLLPGKVIVNGVDLVNGDEDHSIACGDGTAVYDPDTRTLTLTNAQITQHSGQALAACGVYASDLTGDFTIVLVGQNSITLTDQAYDNTGIFRWGSDQMTIEGSGSLAIEIFDDATPQGIGGNNGDILIKDVTLTFALASGSNTTGNMLHTNKTITLDNATISTSDSGYLQCIVSPSDIVIQNGSAVSVSAIENAIYSDGEITITDSTVTAAATDYAAICSWDDISIINSTLDAHSEYDNGLYCYGKVTVSGGTASIVSDESDGLRANGGVTITDEASVTAKGYGAAVYTNEILNMESGRLTAEGENWAILARRISKNAQDSKPADDPAAILLDSGLVETSNAQITTEDWTYTEVWDDWDYDYYDRWMSRSYFVDGAGSKLTKATILAGYTVTVTTDGNGTATADRTAGATGAEVSLNAAPADGYRFKEWQVLAGNVTIENDRFTIGTANVEVKAVFELIPPLCTLTFDANGGAGVMASVQMEPGAYILPECRFIAPQGASFEAWEVAGMRFQPGDAIEVTGDVLVKALWHDEAATLPQTGDNTPIALMAILCLISLTAMIVIHRKRKAA